MTPRNLSTVLEIASGKEGNLILATVIDASWATVKMALTAGFSTVGTKSGAATGGLGAKPVIGRTGLASCWTTDSFIWGMSSGETLAAAISRSISAFVNGPCFNS